MILLLVVVVEGPALVDELDGPACACVWVWLSGWKSDGEVSQLSSYCPRS